MLFFLSIDTLVKCDEYCTDNTQIVCLQGHNVRRCYADCKAIDIYVRPLKLFVKSVPVIPAGCIVFGLVFALSFI